MATAQELQAKLQNKLRELFQLNEPDLDFGFYRVMHAKAKEVNAFLAERLPQEITAAFASTGGAQRQQAFDEAKTALLNGLGPDSIAADGTVSAQYAAVPLAKAYEVARAALAGSSAGDAAEADVYDHLYHFFERYYDKGDFVSLRYLKRETDHAAAAYAIPYGGEEVKLHWANADQYYIKTSENFSHFAFDAVRHPEIAKLDAMARMAAKIPDSCKVQFEIVAADEGDHGNIKQGKDRFFILHAAKPCETKDGTTVVYFEYREDPEQSGPFAKWQERRRAEALDALRGKVPDLLFFDINGGDRKKGVRPLLDVYLKRYFARNTADYFIHKDLGGFLRRELDFYIKNEMIALDDVAAAQPETVAKWLGKVQVFRKIANEIIDFLAQLEDFQKKLWLKRKFVVQCDYCLTMDRVPEALRAEVFANAAQLEEWKRLGFETGGTRSVASADGTGNPAAVQGELAGVGSAPCADRIDARMVDTKFFDESFKQRLLASIDDFDAQCDGVLIHGENFQGLRLLQERYCGQVKCVYIDPPYNAQSSEIAYKNNYKHSSWLSLMQDRILASVPMFLKSSVQVIAIDEVEDKRLGLLLKTLFPKSDNDCIAVQHNPTGQQGEGFSYVHEFAYFTFDQKSVVLGQENREEPNREMKPDIRPLRNVSSGKNHYRESAATCFYPIYVKNGEIVGFGSVCPNDYHPTGINVVRNDGLIEVYPIDPSGHESKWNFGRETVESIRNELTAEYNEKKNEWDIIRRKSVFRYRSMWSDKRYSANSYGSAILNHILPGNPFTFPKSIYNVKDCIAIGTGPESSSTILDYFAGSGTTAHAVIDLNRQDGGKRKYILIEMGDHFDTVLKPRIEKVVYSPDWKDGKPTAPEKGISHCFKYLRLESYEDALNNLEVDGTKGEAFAGISDYFLKYMLQVETVGSASLLNVESFRDPFGYRLVVKKPASEEREVRTVDLVETFNYLIGLRVKHTSETRAYTAAFERKADPELPEDAHTKLTLAGRLRRADDGEWKFRTVEGWCPRNRFTPNDGAKERVLVVWRTLTGDLERDNAVLNAFLEREAVNALDGEYDVIYVNGSNNVPNLRKDSDTWKVRLIEEDFRARMWEGA